MFRRLDAILPSEAGLASNTSSISVTTLSASPGATACPLRRHAFLLNSVAYAARRVYCRRGHRSCLR
ncbi:hypothetical protein [Roseiarcus sp.]|uniref:hypothetical protein n=1 Tax=Roseiarcus sp. TaxID=1969460 RepID=UPI003F9EA2CB